jgi:DNA adenine methylase
MSEPAQPQSRLHHFTPLRYPGGKAKLALYVKSLLKENRLLDGEYVEPYAGGAGIALELLFHEYVSRIHINDVSKLVHAFWKSVLNHTEEFCGLVTKTPLTVAAWDKQKHVLNNPSEHETVQLGFATFFLNRTNRSGILNGGIIGGRDQTGPWKIDARYNAKELVRRIEAIAKMRDRIKLTRQDALKFLKSGVSKWPSETLIYLDPPYYVKGRALYHDFYLHKDHERVANFVKANVDQQRWIVSYDNVPAIRELYHGTRHVVYDIGYSARSASMGSEVMFFCDDLKVPPLIGPIKMTEDHTGILWRMAATRKLPAIPAY